MNKINDIDLKKEEKDYIKNRRYRKLKNAIILMIIILSIASIIMLIISKDDRVFNKINIYSKVTKDGKLEVKEEIKYSSKNADIYKRIIPYKKSEIENLDIRVLSDKKAIKVEKITKEKYDNLNKKDKEKLFYYIGYLEEKENMEDSSINNKINYEEDKEIKEDIKEETRENKDQHQKENKNKNEKIVICMPNTKEFKKTNTLVVGYTLKNQIKKYKDIAELNYKIINVKDNNYIKDLKLEIEFPDDGIKKEDARVWMFGMYNGDSKIISNKVYLDIKEDLKHSEGLKLVTLFGIDKLKEDYKFEDKEYKKNAAKYYNEEFIKQNKYIEDEIKENKKIKKQNDLIIYISGIIFAGFMVKIGIDIINEVSYRKDIKSVIKSFKYYNNPPEEFKFNFTKIYPLVETSKDKLFESIFLKLIYKGLLIPNKQKKLFSISNYNFLTKKIKQKENKKRDIFGEALDIEYIFVLDEKDYIRQDSLGYIYPEDKYVYSVLKSISNENEFTLSELNEYLKRNYKANIEENLRKLIYSQKDNLLDSGYFDKDSNKKDLNIIKQKTFNIFLLLIFIILSIVFYKEFTFPIYISFFIFLIYMLNYLKYKIHLKGINAKGLQVEAQIIGFRNFLRDSSFLDLKSDNKKDINSIRQYLMYSVYFGISDKFFQKTLQYNDVNFRRIYKELEEQEEQNRNKEDLEDTLKFKYGDCPYVLRKIQESINISKTYYTAGLGLNDTIEKIDNSIKKKRTLKFK